MIKNLASANVLVIGDVMLDKYYYGKTFGISPEAPVPIVKLNNKNQEYRAGGAANVANNIAKIGANAEIISFVGDDEDADILLDILQKQNVKCFFEKCTKNTIRKTRIISQNQQQIRLDFDSDYQQLDIDLKNYKKLLAKSNVVVLSDYGKGVLTNTNELIDIATSMDVDVIVDPKGNDWTKYNGSSLITPNMSEFEAVVGKCSSDKELIKKGFALIKRNRLKALLITRSEKGMILLKDGEPKPYNLSTTARDVFDVTGAGDTVVAILSTALATGYTLEQATNFANIAAGIVVAKVGTASVTIQELNQAIHEINTQKQDTKIIDKKQLKNIIDNLKLGGQSIVFTNGCFDIIHKGHIRYLQKAKSLGDKLIVAINSDDSVKKLKGNNRPINDLTSRMEVLQAIDSVDYVVSFAQDTPKNLIEYLSPDVLVKGGDYKPEDIAGYDSVTKNGGEVFVVDFVDGFSTSNIINKINSNK